MKGSILRGLKAATEILLPRQCITCGQKLLLDEKHLCLECLADLPLTYFWTISHNPMADKFNAIMQERLNGSDESLRDKYAYAAALFFYHSDADYRLIPYQIKYHGNLQAGKYFGKMLGKRLASSEQFADVDMIVPVPLHWTRKWKRGYNQAEVIASGVSESLGVPMKADILKRRKRTKTQTKVDVEAKAQNVSNAFALSHDILESLDTSGNMPEHLLLIDDVFTTGSTLMACFTALRAVFPPSVHISVATLAFVGGP